VITFMRFAHPELSLIYQMQNSAFLLVCKIQHVNFFSSYQIKKSAFTLVCSIPYAGLLVSTQTHSAFLFVYTIQRNPWARPASRSGWRFANCACLYATVHVRRLVPVHAHVPLSCRRERTKCAGTAYLHFATLGHPAIGGDKTWRAAS
jgi:hypothetical protein